MRTGIILIMTAIIMIVVIANNKPKEYVMSEGYDPEEHSNQFKNYFKKANEAWDGPIYMGEEKEGRNFVHDDGYGRSTGMTVRWRLPNEH